MLLETCLPPIDREPRSGLSESHRLFRPNDRCRLALLVSLLVIVVSSRPSEGAGTVWTATASEGDLVSSWEADVDPKPSLPPMVFGLGEMIGLVDAAGEITRMDAYDGYRVLATGGSQQCLLLFGPPRPDGNDRLVFLSARTAVVWDHPAPQLFRKTGRPIRMSRDGWFTVVPKFHPFEGTPGGFSEVILGDGRLVAKSLETDYQFPRGTSTGDYVLLETDSKTESNRLICRDAEFRLQWQVDLPLDYASRVIDHIEVNPHLHALIYRDGPRAIHVITIEHGPHDAHVVVNDSYEVLRDDEGSLRRVEVLPIQSDPNGPTALVAFSLVSRQTFVSPSTGRLRNLSEVRLMRMDFDGSGPEEQRILMLPDYRLSLRSAGTNASGTRGLLVIRRRTSDTSFICIVDADGKVVDSRDVEGEIQDAAFISNDMFFMRTSDRVCVSTWNEE